MKKALITGVNGQDGSYLAEYLLDLGYEVHGTKRRSSSNTNQRLYKLKKNVTNSDLDYLVKLHHADVTDSSSLNRLIQLIKPDEIYNLAAQSHVAVSFEEPEYTANSDALGCLRILEAIKQIDKKIKFYQASTSELFGGQKNIAYDEDSPINPRSPYAAAKAYAYYITRQYREGYGLFACNGILFNHESPRRSENFVTQKIILGLKKICAKEIDYLTLGNLNSSRDWGHAKDYVRSMVLILNHDVPKDWVVATGESRTVREFVIIAFKIFGITIEFQGEGLEEKAVVIKSDKNTVKVGQIVVRIDKNFFRPLEVDYLIGNPKRIKQELGWSPKYSFAQLVYEMIHGE
jgi:GDPmannose 4,6-dehydratase